MNILKAVYEVLYKCQFDPSVLRPKDVSVYLDGEPMDGEDVLDLLADLLGGAVEECEAGVFADDDEDVTGVGAYAG